MFFVIFKIECALQGEGGHETGVESQSDSAEDREQKSKERTE